MKRLLALLTTVACMVSTCDRVKAPRPPDESWDPPASEYVVAQNEIRKERGIPEIRSDWVFLRRCDDCETWRASRKHVKHIYFQSALDCIVHESDEYYSGRRFPSDDGEASAVDEFLVVGYWYGAERFVVDIVTGDPNVREMVGALTDGVLLPGVFGGYVQVGHRGTSNEETLAIVDEILRTWGLSRF